ncbi:phosphoribosyltransferase family protein [Sulfurovum sp. zt1-1]|uniref:Phosphoribosyltransferase family protein n=1 Tax=Sulfurovum zhangzhouensis TaxID=3019067 RepID=A0ABT7R0L9_9BACT|nr:phosphoribosyltransferase family protein [Sulfurovum zhangzhouensis]MDM5272636.1 phosphoribosyltransferase family protein [Sulfurovum zhangzhouensis]
MNRVYYPYEEFREDLKILANKIDKPFDAILCIARGGMTMAHLLGEYFDMREVYSVNTIGYEDTQKNESVEVFNIPELKSAKSVLILDDIVDSGDTLIEVLNVLSEKYPEVTFMTASLFYKKSAKIAPDWCVKEATKWIDFFWTVDLKQ